MRMSEKKATFKIKTRTKSPEIRQNELMEAAQGLFIEKGFEGVAISEITDCAGVAKGTFYHYFSSKSEIMEALRERYTLNFTDKVQRELKRSPESDLIARFRTWCITSVSVYVESKKVHDALFHGDFHAHGNRERDAILEQINRLVSEGVRTGCFHSRNICLTSILIYHGFHGAVDSMECMNSSTNNLGNELADELLKLLKVTI